LSKFSTSGVISVLGFLMEFIDKLRCRMPNMRSELKAPDPLYTGGDLFRKAEIWLLRDEKFVSEVLRSRTVGRA
jgi:hypothetical protein